MTKYVQLIAAGALLCAGCDGGAPADPDAGMTQADSGGADGGTTPAPLWVATGWTQSGDEYSGFLATVGDLLGGQISLPDVVDLGTDMSFGTDERGTVFVGRDDSPIIERWALDDAGVLQKTGQINLSALGITSAMGGNRNVIQIISDTRAYYFDNEGFRVVVFDPTAMTITDDFSIDAIQTGASSSSLNFIAREGDRFFVSARLWDADDETIKELRVAVVSATSNEVEYLTDTRCGDMGFVAKDDEGNIYFGSHHALAVFADPSDPDAAQPCMLRILQNETEFDPSYHVELNELLDGFGGGLFQGPDGSAFIAKYESSDPISAAALRQPVWRMYSVELGNEASSLTQVAALPLVARYVSTFEVEIDGELVPFLVTENAEGSVYTSLADPSAPTDGLSVEGASLGRAARLR